MQLELLSDILGYFGIGSACLPILFFLKKNRINKNLVAFKILKIISITYFTSNVATLLLFLYTSINQNFLINLHSSLEFFLLLFFYRSIIKSWILKRFFSIITIFFGVFFTLTFLEYRIDENYTILNVCQKLFLFLFSLKYLNIIYRSDKYDSLTQAPYFWINIAVLLYNASSLYISIFEGFLRNENIEVFFMLWPILQISGIIYYVLFAIGLWKLKD